MNDIKNCLKAKLWTFVNQCTQKCHTVKLKLWPIAFQTMCFLEIHGKHNQAPLTASCVVFVRTNWKIMAEIWWFCFNCRLSLPSVPWACCIVTGKSNLWKCNLSIYRFLLKPSVGVPSRSHSRPFRSRAPALMCLTFCTHPQFTGQIDACGMHNKFLWNYQVRLVEQNRMCVCFNNPLWLCQLLMCLAWQVVQADSTSVGLLWDERSPVLGRLGAVQSHQSLQ